MAARRVSKTAVDWVAFSERVPPNQKEAFRALKAKSDGFLAKVHSHPEVMPEINFSKYRSRLANPALVDQMEKGLQSLSIPYPTDHKNIKAAVDTQAKAALASRDTAIKELENSIVGTRDLGAMIDKIPPLKDMTHEMYYEYFPHNNPYENPTFFPHAKGFQPNPNDSVNTVDYTPIKNFANKIKAKLPVA